MRYRDMSDRADIDVYYDGECPICRWEVDLYARMDKAGRIHWSDITEMSEQELPLGKTRNVLLGKFHVRERAENESWYIGVDAFARIWRALPGLRYGAFLFKVPVLRQFFMLAYRAFLKWQGWHRTRRRCA